jgi:hypothetical protein
MVPLRRDFGNLRLNPHRNDGRNLGFTEFMKQAAKKR